MKERMTTELKEEEKQRDRLADQDARAGGFGSKNPPPFEVLIIKNLAASVTAPPLRKIELILDASDMVPHEVLAKTLMKDRLEEIRVIGSVNRSLLQAREALIGGVPRVSIPWEISDDEYKRFIAPWIKNIEIEWIQDLLSPFEENLAHELDAYARSNSKEQTQRTRFFVLGQYLTTFVVQRITVSFLIWAGPIINELAATTAALLSPSAQRVFERVMTMPEAQK
jgi:hypothetical protein